MRVLDNIFIGALLFHLANGTSNYRVNEFRQLYNLAFGNLRISSGELGLTRVAYSINGSFGNFRASSGEFGLKITSCEFVVYASWK